LVTKLKHCSQAAKGKLNIFGTRQVRGNIQQCLKKLRPLQVFKPEAALLEKSGKTAYDSSSGCGAKTHLNNMTTAPITTINPIIPAGVFNVSVKSKMNPISVLPVIYIFKKCYV
jgi:hypothetical protein